MEKFKEKFSKISCEKVLDVGTGTGNFISKLKLLNDYEKIVAIDNSDKMLEKAKENFNDGNIKFLKMDAKNMDFSDGEFDLLSLSNSLHHLPDIESIFREMKRVLAKDGLLIINEMFCDEQKGARDTYVDLHHYGAHIDRILGDTHFETYSKSKIKEIIKESGIRIVDTFIYTQFEGELEKKETIDYFLNAVDKKLEIIKNKKEYDELKIKAEKLKEKINETGLQIPDHLLIIGEKL